MGSTTGPVISDNGTIRVPAFDLPFSTLASREARDAYVVGVRRAADLAREDSPGVGKPSARDPEAQRRRADDDIILPKLAKQLARWPDVRIEPWEIDDVYTEVFTPPRIATTNTERVLVNLHGGGFTVGGRTQGRLESVPIAALGQITVISIDYRMAPESTFPAASEDVATVYRQLLNDYLPENIGIYGSSAGGMLTAQAVAWLVDVGLPLPGAIGMFGGTGRPFQGDSASLAPAYLGAPLALDPTASFGWPDGCPYFTSADLEKPLVFPMLWPELLSNFPPALLITSGRAAELSSIVDAHNRLTRAGVASRLHIWDGLSHCFYLDADLPESHDVEDVIVGFFAECLGKPSSSTRPHDSRARTRHG